MAYTIPSDTHIVSDTGHTIDHDNIADVLTLLAGGVAVFNVMNTAYGGGAKFDGSTDDITALQAAATAANSFGGGILQCPGGTAIISQTLQLGSKTTLAGVGMGATTIKAKASMAATQVGSNPGMVMVCTIGNNAASKVTIRDLTLDMNEANIASVPGYATQSECSPLGIQNVTGLTIERVEVINAIGYSVFPWGCTDVKIRDCRILAGQASAHSYNQQDGIHVTDSTGIRITGNYVDTGTAANGGDDAIVIQGVSAGSSNAVIHGNTIAQAGAHGIVLVLGGATVTGVTITGNVVASTTSEGLLFAFNVYVASGTYLISDVTVTGNVFRNIATANAASGITLQDAYGGTGAHAGTAGYANVVISGNELDGFTNTTGFGIYAQAGSDLTVSNNTITNWKAVRGIDIGDNSASTSRPVANATVSGNVIDMSTTTATAPVGVCVVDSPNAMVAANSVIGASGPIASSIGISLLSIGTSIAGAVVSTNRVRNWATGISETNNGVAPANNIFAGNNTLACTAHVSVVGTGDVNANNI